MRNCCTAASNGQNAARENSLAAQGHFLYCLHFLHGDKFEGMGGAFGDAGRPQSCINAIHAVITFDRLIGVAIVLGNSPGTGTGAGHTANAGFKVNKDDAIRPFLHGAGGTDRDTQGTLAVVAGAEGKLRFGDTAYRFKGFMVDFAENRPHRQVLILLTVDLTAMTANAALAV